MGSRDDKGTHALAGRDTVTASNYLRAMYADEYLYPILNTRSSGARHSARSSPGRARLSMTGCSKVVHPLSAQKLPVRNAPHVGR